jgi:hypothetical protein
VSAITFGISKSQNKSKVPIYDISHGEKETKEKLEKKEDANFITESV